MHVSHLGHASLLVETDRSRVLVDPGGLSDGWHDVVDLDLVVITHQHVDHVDLERLPALVTANPGARLIADPDTVARLHDLDIAADTMVAGTTVRVGDVQVTGHGSTHAALHPTIPGITNVGVVVAQDGGARILHPGDALEVAASVDVVALPIDAPWATVAMLADWATRVDAATFVPIHDALLSPAGRRVHLRILQGVLPATTMADLADGSRLTL